MAVTITGLDDVLAKLTGFAVDMDKVIDDTVKITAFKVQSQAIFDIKEPSQGKAIKKGSKIHIQSLEGNAPNTDTGRLIGSIMVEHNKGDQFAFVGTNLDYGFFLETVHNRPWLEPAKEAQVEFFADNMKAVIEKEIAEAGK